MGRSWHAPNRVHVGRIVSSSPFRTFGRDWEGRNGGSFLRGNETPVHQEMHQCRDYCNSKILLLTRWAELHSAGWTKRKEILRWAPAVGALWQQFCTRHSSMPLSCHALHHVWFWRILQICKWQRDLQRKTGHIHISPACAAQAPPVPWTQCVSKGTLVKLKATPIECVCVGGGGAVKHAQIEAPFFLVLPFWCARAKGEGVVQELLHWLWQGVHLPGDAHYVPANPGLAALCFQSVAILLQNKLYKGLTDSLRCTKLCLTLFCGVNDPKALSRAGKVSRSLDCPESVGWAVSDGRNTLWRTSSRGWKSSARQAEVLITYVQRLMSLSDSAANMQHVVEFPLNSARRRISVTQSSTFAIVKSFRKLSVPRPAPRCWLPLKLILMPVSPNRYSESASWSGLTSRDVLLAFQFRVIAKQNLFLKTSLSYQVRRLAVGHQMRHRRLTMVVVHQAWQLWEECWQEWT